MSQSPPESSAPTLAERLGEARVEMRPDLAISRHVFRGEPSYIVLDPLTSQTHRLSAADYRILCSLRVDRTLTEVMQGLIESGKLEEADTEGFFQFVFSLHKIGFLKLPISDETVLYRRHMAKKEARRSQRVTSFLFWQIPVVNPDAFLTRTLRYVRPFFTQTAFYGWLALVGIALLTVVRSWDEFSRPMGDIFSSGNLPALWATLIVLKVAHEFGHAYATKHFGGHVPEMGVFLIVFTPCAYVDATASWGFSRKRDRLIVSMAGMYVELALAAVAVILWAISPPGFVQSLLHNVVILASVVTIGFNVNPLMRYDGYYALCDVAEIPNLRSRASAYGNDVLKRVLLGIRSTQPWGSRGHRTFLLLFGTCAAVYKVFLVLGISILIATKMLVVGLLIGTAYMVNEIVRILRRTIPYLWYSEEASPVRAKAIAISLVFFGVVPIAVLGIPTPSHIHAPGLVAGGEESVLRAETSGFLRLIDVQPGTEVAAGQLIALLEQPGVGARLAEVEARLEAARLRRDIYSHTDPTQATQEQERVQQLEREREHLATEVGRLELRARVSGVVVECLAQAEIGRYVQRGELIATLSDGSSVVYALLTAEDVAAARPAPGQEVEFKSPVAPERVFRGTIRRLTPTGSRTLDDRFHGHLDLTDFAIDPATGDAGESHFEVEVSLQDTEGMAAFRGATGRVRLTGEMAPVAEILVRKALIFANRIRG